LQPTGLCRYTRLGLDGISHRESCPVHITCRGIQQRFPQLWSLFRIDPTAFSFVATLQVIEPQWLKAESWQSPVECT
jgi:hypothetical protein